MAPERNVLSLSGMTRSASMCCSTPNPPQAGQAPNGLLNENSRGSISGMVKPDTGQAKRCEKVRRGGSPPSPLPGAGVGGGAWGGCGPPPRAPPPPPPPPPRGGGGAEG